MIEQYHQDIYEQHHSLLESQNTVVSLSKEASSKPHYRREQPITNLYKTFVIYGITAMVLALALASSCSSSSTSSISRRSLRSTYNLLPYHQQIFPEAQVMGTSRRPKGQQKKFLVGCNNENSDIGFNRLINLHGWAEAASAASVNGADFIIFCKESDLAFYPIPELRRTGTTVAFFCKDITTCFGDNIMTDNFLAQYVDTILSPDGPQFTSFFPKTDVEWVPHTADLAVLELEFKEVVNFSTVLVNGKQMMDKKASFTNAFAAAVDPTLLSFSSMTDTFTVEALASHVATVASIDSLNRISSEVFNVFASGSLAIVSTEAVPLLTSLGMEDNVHYVSVDTNEENIREKVKWVLDPENTKQVLKMRLAAYELIRERHTIAIRTQQVDDFFAQLKGLEAVE